MTRASFNPSGSRVPRPYDTCDIRALPINPQEAFLLSRIDGSTSEHDLVLLTGFDPRTVQGILDRLHGLGAIAWVRDKTEEAQSPVVEPPPPPTQPSRPSGIQHRGELDEATKQDILATLAVLEQRNYYELLGVTQLADRKELRRCYHARAPAYHPDRFFGKDLGPFKPKMEAIFSRLTLAYETLSDHERRSEYDAYLAAQRDARAMEQLLSGPARSSAPEADSAPPLVSPSNPVHAGNACPVPTSAVPATPPPGVAVSWRPASPPLGPTTSATLPPAPNSATSATVPPPTTQATTPAAGPLRPTMHATRAPAATPVSSALGSAPLASSISAAASARGAANTTCAGTATPGTPTSQPAASPHRSSTPARMAEAERARREALVRKLGISRATLPPEARVSTSPPPRSLTDPESAAFEQRRREASALLESQRNSIRRHVEAARACAAAGNAAAAANEYRLARAIDPNDPNLARAHEEATRIAATQLAGAYLRQADYEARNGNWVEAARSYERAAAGMQGDPVVLERTAAAILKAGGDTHRVVEHARRALSLAPNRIEPHLLLAEVHLGAGRTLLAKRALDAARELSPDDDRLKELAKKLK